MSCSAEISPVGIASCDCVTPLGNADRTVAQLLEGKTALRLQPVLGRDGGDEVPLATIGTMDESLPPRWLPVLQRFAASIPAASWGSPRFPVIVTSSNFGVGSLYAFTRDREKRHLAHGTPFASVELLRQTLGWGEHVHVFSHACVTAHLGLAHAARLLHAGLADQVLVFTFDFVSPFVAGGFHSLKILNAAMPAPFAARDIGAIGLGDGAAYAVLSLADSAYRLQSHAMYNEMYHFTSNQPAGEGFTACLRAMAESVGPRRVWIKGHGTGTLDAGRLEAEAAARIFPGAPLVSWKGSLGHTLGSCGLVELAITLAALRAGRSPGTVGSAGPCFSEAVALAPFSTADFDAVVLSSNAFGGAHAATLLTYE
jgi:3-oxoacyl-(acyl-carrier-protein) synthase